VLQSSAPPGLPQTLNQTSVSVTVNGVTTTPGLYYTSASAVSAVLPSSTPVGTGTVTVTYNGIPSVVRHSDAALSRVRRARVTFSRMSDAFAVQINGFGDWL
jgi:uncharacterized protein (TIGR03437 family)